MASLVPSYSTSKVYDGVKLADGPGTGAYPFPARFTRKESGSKSIRKKKHNKRGAELSLSKSLSALNIALASDANEFESAFRPPPSIPDRNHTGYTSITSSSGATIIKANDPVVPVYRGQGTDTVGPTDYEPNENVRFRTPVQTNFTKGPRDLHRRLSFLESQSKPGPGAYDLDSNYQRWSSSRAGTAGGTASRAVTSHSAAANIETEMSDPFGDTFNLTEVNAIPPQRRMTSDTIAELTFQFQPDANAAINRSRSTSPSASSRGVGASGSGKLMTGFAGLKSRGQQFQHLVETETKRPDSHPNSAMLREYEERQRTIRPPIQGTYKVRKVKGRKYPTHFALFGTTVKPTEQPQEMNEMCSSAQQQIVPQKFNDSMMTSDQLAAVSSSVSANQAPGATLFKSPTDMEWYTVVPDNFSTKPSNITISTSGKAKQSRQSHRRKDVYPSPHSPTISDFDRMTQQAMRQKALCRTESAQRISFASSEKKFHEMDPPPYAKKTAAPEGFHYKPKIGLGDLAPKQNPKSGAFGAKDERFRELKDNFDPPEDPFSLATLRMQEELADVLPPGGRREAQVRGGLDPVTTELSTESAARPFANSYVTDPFLQQPLQRSPTSSLSAKPSLSSGFVSSIKQRLDPPIMPSPRPAPNAYDTYPKWNAKGTAILAPPAGKSRKQHEELPGPGTYSLATQLVDERRNPKQVMISSSRRDPFADEYRAPGPGEYEITPVVGAFIKKTFNTLLVD